MANNLFITATETGSGKSLISLGVMEMLLRKIKKVGFFRPIIDTEPDINNTNIEITDPETGEVVGYLSDKRTYDIDILQNSRRNLEICHFLFKIHFPHNIKFVNNFIFIFKFHIY